MRLLNVFTVCSTRPLFVSCTCHVVMWYVTPQSFLLPSEYRASKSVRRLTIQRTVCVQSYVCLKTLFAYTYASTSQRHDHGGISGTCAKKGGYQGWYTQLTCAVNAFRCESKHIYSREQTHLHKRANTFNTGDKHILHTFVSGDKRMENVFALYLVSDQYCTPSKLSNFVK